MQIIYGNSLTFLTCLLKTENELNKKLLNIIRKIQVYLILENNNLSIHNYNFYIFGIFQLKKIEYYI